jgi:SpoVK/Ycf46/Vps4 family AAA+-type ATPase
MVLGQSGADIAFVAKEAALNALRRTVDIAGLIRGEEAASPAAGSIQVAAEDFRHAVGKLASNTL